MSTCLIKKSFFGPNRYGTSDTEGGHSRGGDDWPIPVGRVPSTGPGHHQEAPKTHLFPLSGSRHTGLRGKYVYSEVHRVFVRSIHHNFTILF